MNPAYRHLEEPVRIGDFTLLQLGGMILCGLIAVIWAFVISPLPPIWTLATAVYVAGLPASAIFLASTTEFDAWRVIKAFVRFQRIAGCFRSGPGEPRPGYVVHPKEDKRAARELALDDRPLAVEGLWSE